MMKAPLKLSASGLRSAIQFLIAVLLFFDVMSATGATFTNNASIQLGDPGNSLTSTNGIFTVACWFRISIPSSLTLADNMDLLMDRTDGNEAANFSYLLRYNITNNTIEFTTHGSAGSYTKTLIQSPYLERWYHVAVIRPLIPMTVADA